MEPASGPQKVAAENQELKETHTPKPDVSLISPLDATPSREDPAQLRSDRSHNLGDSLGIAGLAIAGLAWALAPTLWEKAAAIVAAAGIVTYLAYRSYFTRNISRRGQHVMAALSLLIVLVGGGWQVFNQWRSDRVAMFPARSHLGAQLIIDSAGKDVIQFHFVLSNEGPFEIQVIRVDHHNDCGFDSDGDLVRSRIILPNDKLIVNEVIFTKEMNCGPLYLRTSYNTASEGIQKAFTATFGFTIRPIDLHPQTLYAISHDEIDGGPTNNPKEDFLRGFSQPHGVLTLRWPEKRPNGEVNELDIKSGPQELRFDPILKVVIFTSTVNGRALRILRPLGIPKDGKHLIVAAWNENGELRLLIDGATR